MSDTATPPPDQAADFTAPIKTVQEAATGFSSDALSWLQDSTAHAVLVLGFIICVILGLQLLRRGLLYMLGGRDGHPHNRFSAVAYRLIRHTSVIFVSLFGCWLVAQVIRVPSGVLSGLNLAFTIAGLIQVGLWAREVVLLLIERRLTRQGILSADSSVSSAVGVISWLVNLIVWSVTLLLLLDNLGVNITALVAGLGIGGLAIGLAAQGIMADLFSALSIVFDKPFVRGDFIAFADKQGTVEKVGLKTSRLRALTGEMIVVSNNHLLNATIHNFQQMIERRVVFSLGIVYSTPTDLVEKVPGLLQAAIEQDEKCRFDRAHLISFGDSALNFEVVYYYRGRDFNPYRDSHQAILLRIMRAFEQHSIGFAFPTRTVHLVNQAA